MITAVLVFNYLLFKTHATGINLSLLAFFLRLLYLVFLGPHLSFHAGGLYLIFDLS